MYHQMENAFAHVEVDELGAQLHSLRRRKDGYEYLWQGDPAIWPGQAPILFPIVGSLAEERYWLGGQPGNGTSGSRRGEMYRLRRLCEGLPEGDH